MTAAGLWQRANRQLVAKSIGELAYEGVLEPRETAPGRFEVGLAGGVRYAFAAWRTAWDYLRVDADSIVRRAEDASGRPADSAGQFFVDARAELGMDDLALGNFLEEMQSTLYADQQCLALQENHSADEIAEWPDVRVQSVLGGHPKILLNKGRLGWGAGDLARYSPESGETFVLQWIAVRADRARVGLRAGLDVSALGAAESSVRSPREPQDRPSAESRSHLLAESRVHLLAESLDAAERRRFAARVRERLDARGLRSSDYLVLPVHPWQWDRVVQIQFAGEIADDVLVPLGEFGDRYRPQTSLRTLSNASRPGRLDLKLPLSILNTSAIRGIPLRYLERAPALSQAMASLCAADPVLSASGTRVLEEIAAVGMAQPTFAQVAGAPYRYHEQLGAIWRAAPAGADGERSVLAAGLFHRDADGRSLLGAYVRRSGLNLEDWLRLYFEAAVIPLYHLQLRYGIGLVAHGQNVVLRLRDGRPTGIWIKDFQGDLRLAEGANLARRVALGDLEDGLDRLPAEHLIHDLVTGHFLTVLRFVSATLQECEGFAESRFYALLRETIDAYLQAHRPPRGLAGDQDLLRETFQRVLLNKVRFAIGYADSAARPRPLVGRELRNPLYAPTRDALHAPAGAPLAEDSPTKEIVHGPA